MTAEQCERAVMVEHWGRTQCPNPAVITKPRPVCRKHLDEMRLRARLNVIKATIDKEFQP